MIAECKRLDHVLLRGIRGLMNGATRVEDDVPCGGWMGRRVSGRFDGRTWD